MKKRIIMFLLVFGLLETAHPASAELDGESDCDLTIQPSVPVNSPGELDTPGDAFYEHFKQADCLRQAAAERGLEWLETEKLLKRALQAADKGGWQEAFRLMEKARFQAERALQQAKHESAAWKHRVIE